MLATKCVTNIPTHFSQYHVECALRIDGRIFVCAMDTGCTSKCSKHNLIWCKRVTRGRSVLKSSEVCKTVRQFRTFSMDFGFAVWEQDCQVTFQPEKYERNRMKESDHQISIENCRHVGSSPAWIACDTWTYFVFWIRRTNRKSLVFVHHICWNYAWNQPETQSNWTPPAPMVIILVLMDVWISCTIENASKNTRANEMLKSLGLFYRSMNNTIVMNAGCRAYTSGTYCIPTMTYYLLS